MIKSPEQPSSEGLSQEAKHVMIMSHCHLPTGSVALGMNVEGRQGLKTRTYYEHCAPCKDIDWSHDTQIPISATCSL